MILPQDTGSEPKIYGCTCAQLLWLQVLQELRIATSAFTASQMQITPEQGQFMAMLVKLIGARNYLEIGVFTGYSLIATALALPADGCAVALDRDPRALKVARQFVAQAGVVSKVDIREGPALELLEDVGQEYGAGHFDLVFIGVLPSALPSKMCSSMRIAV
jgi:predicted O-methyltransferase YrrM